MASDDYTEQLLSNKVGHNTTLARQGPKNKWVDFYTHNIGFADVPPSPEAGRRHRHRPVPNRQPGHIRPYRRDLSNTLVATHRWQGRQDTVRSLHLLLRLSSTVGARMLQFRCYGWCHARCGRLSSPLRIIHCTICYSWRPH